ncbi:MAG: hypothetical protein WHX52_08790 [Anaerolineae bacterium]
MKNCCLIALVILIAFGLSSETPWRPAVSRAAVTYGAPALKWQHAGCYSSWCETGWYASPAVADLDGDNSERHHHAAC